MHTQKKFTTAAGITLLCAAFFLGGIYIGYHNRESVSKITNISHTHAPGVVDADFEPFWKAWVTLSDKSIYMKDVSNEEKIWGAIKGLAHSTGDQYTEFFDPKETGQFNEAISGEFSGVGIEIAEKDKILTVITPIKGSPAALAGIKSGDRILKIDNHVTNDLAVDEAVSYIRGEAGTKVVLTIFHEGDKETKEVTVTRQVITVPSLDSKAEGDYFIVTLATFTGTNIEEDMRHAMLELKASGKKKLIIDLRQNPGGYLDAAVQFASYFLPKGDMIVSEDFGSKKTPENHTSSGFTELGNTEYKIAILVDEGSASASEILAGALHDHNKAILVGEKTFGKGSVQEIVPITSDTVLKVTIAKWLTPNGVSIQDNGITPDYEVKDDEKTTKDEVLEKAKALLK